MYSAVFGMVVFPHSKIWYTASSGSSIPRSLHSTKADAPSEKRAPATLTSVGFVLDVSSRLHRTFRVQSSHAKHKMRAGRFRAVAPHAISAATRIVVIPPAHPIPAKSIFLMSRLSPNFWATKRSYPGVVASVQVTEIVCVRS